MVFDPHKPLIAQSDASILLEVDNPYYEEVRDRLSLFAELVKSPEHIHTYRVTPLSIWNAAAAGVELDTILSTLEGYSKFDVPANLVANIRDYLSRYGKLWLEAGDEHLNLFCDDPYLMAELRHNRKVMEQLIDCGDKNRFLVPTANRGNVKQLLVKLGYPVKDIAGYTDGDPLALALRDRLPDGEPFGLRYYQDQAAAAFHQGGRAEGGSGVIVLPCGSGKTVVGLATMNLLQTSTLILATNIVALRQWREEILTKTTLKPDQISEYSGEHKDIAGYTDGDPLALALRDRLPDGEPFGLRYYQDQAAAAFHQGGRAEGGSGVIVLPCGSGKTVVGLATMNLLQTSTLILATNIVALRQWREEILTKTTLKPDQISEYSGEHKDFAPVTIATYQIVVYRKDKNGPFPHFHLFNARNWGLIIYDEVHLLPAPVFRATAEIQSKRRLGLTATLVREDGLEEEVFSLIGPKRFDVPWKELEGKGWIATAECHEIRLPLDPRLRLDYATADNRTKFRIASENGHKMAVIQQLLARHQGDRILVIGQYLSQLREISDELQAPLITGQTPNSRREELFEDFRHGVIKTLVVSKVANFAIDLPDANVAIQVSGTFGSRQEEAQRLGRILRPKKDQRIAHFYSVVSRDTVEQDYANRRQMFLTEQGYSYEIVDQNATA